MSTYTNAAELAGKELKSGDEVVFSVQGVVCKYEVYADHLEIKSINLPNELIFDVLDISKTRFAEKAFGYKPYIWGFPHCEDIRLRRPYPPSDCPIC